jgi:hypothetical protein
MFYFVENLLFAVFHKNMLQNVKKFNKSINNTLKIKSFIIN